MVLTGKINGSSVANRLNLDWFNAQVRQKFKESIEAGNTSDLPTIEIEVYFASPDEDEIAIKKYRGTNNSLHEDAEGVKLEIIFDTQYAPAYKQLLVEGKVRDIPVEYYRVNFRSFANPEYYVQTTARKVACIDTTKKDYGPVLSRFVYTSINEYLSEEDMTELRHAYRANRHEFTENQAVIRLNQKLQEGHSFDGKTIGLNLRESGIDEWKGDMSISLDGIPLENSGFGTQNMFKSEIFLLQNTDVDILIIDDIGAEKVTDWGRDEILGTILQTRMNNLKTTFFTSNFTLKELERHLSNNGSEPVKSSRIIERIKFLCQDMEMISKNYRN